MIDDLLGMATCGDKSIELNSIINAKVESKKLRLSEDKCYKIHICKKKSLCTQVLKVHDSTMKTVTQATYLGDVLSEKGTIDETIEQRCQKAYGIISQITSMLSSISLGCFHFDIALVLREAKFVNSIMTNSEVWHNVFQYHIETLEKLDLDLLRQVMKGHSKTAKEAYFLELGIYPLRFVLAKRRLMYLWHILHRDDSELIKKIYVTQKLKYNRGDWGEIIEEEMRKYQIEMSDQEISMISRERFKSLVDKKVESFALRYLTLEAEKHSKSEHLKNNTSLKRGKYFSDRRFSREDVQLLFALRTRMIECKNNFKEQYNNQLKCRICKEEDSIENEDHLLTCATLSTESFAVSFSDVYGDIDEQFKVTQIFKKILRKRRVYLDAMEKQSSINN